MFVEVRRLSLGLIIAFGFLLLLSEKVVSSVSYSSLPHTLLKSGSEFAMCYSTDSMLLLLHFISTDSSNVESCVM